MNMQDKEFDNLFHSKLDDFETEPSTNVWQNIDEGLSANKRKRLLVPLLSAAASIIIVIAVGALLITRHVQDTAHHPANNNIANVKTTIEKPVISNHTQPTQIAKVEPVSGASLPKQTAVAISIKKKPIIIQTNPNNVTVPQQQVINQPAQQMVVAVVPYKHDVDIVQPQKVDTTLLTSNLSKPDVRSVETVTPVIPSIAKAAPQPVKKHHIHSLGDMLNTVIAAVDKRKDKVIEFTDTDDDQSEITGVNLGIVAVKKQN